MAEEVMILPHSTPMVFVGAHLTEDGTPTGNINANGDYSITPASFWYTPDVGEEVYLTHINFYIEDSGSFDSGKYGNGLILTNGISVSYTNNGVKTMLSSPLNPIKMAGDLASYGCTIDYQKFGSGNEWLNASYSFRDRNAPLYLNGSTGDKIQVDVADNLTGLIRHNFSVSGFRKR